MKLSFLSKISLFFSSPCTLFRQEVQFTEASVGFNWLSINFVWLIMCHPPEVGGCVLLTFRWHLLNIIFRCRHLYFLEAFGPVDLSALGIQYEKNMEYTAFSSDLNVWSSKEGLCPIVSPSALLFMKHQKRMYWLQPSKDFIIQHKDQGWEAAGRAFWSRPPGVELHTVLTLWSPWCWGTRLLSTFQPTCHRAGIRRSKRTSNTSKSDPCINAERRLHHLHSAGRHFHLVQAMCQEQFPPGDEDDLSCRGKWREAKTRI